jgi:hypothetical protein
MSSSSAKRLTVAGLGLILAAGAGTWVAADRKEGRRRMPPSAQARSVDAASAPVDPDELVEFRDDRVGFALSYPKAWVRATAPNPEIVLVAAEHDPAKNVGGSILVRVTPLDAPVERGQLGETRKATDALVTSSEGVVLKAEPIETEQGGLPGLYYLYTFRDPVSGLVGAHSHYFLFRGSTMISIVFQALPDGHFGRLAPLFDRVAATVRAL